MLSLNEIRRVEVRRRSIGQIVWRYFLLRYWRQTGREKERERPTTYFVDTMGHKCVATGPVDIRQADCSLCHCAPDCRLFEARRTHDAPPPVTYCLLTAGPVINDGLRGRLKTRRQAWRFGTNRELCTRRFFWLFF